MFLPLYLSTNKSIVSLKAFGSSSKVVMSWNIIPAHYTAVKTKKMRTWFEKEHDEEKNCRSNHTLYPVGNENEEKKQNKTKKGEILNIQAHCFFLTKGEASLWWRPLFVGLSQSPSPSLSLRLSPKQRTSITFFFCQSHAGNYVELMCDLESHN